MKFLNVVLGMFLVLIFTAFASVSSAMPNKSHDGEIIAYMEAINNGEINAAKVATGKQIDANVMKFAEMMIDQHGKNLQEVTELSNSTKIAEDETPAVEKFKENGDKDLTSLYSLDGNKFQKAYVDAMVKGHTAALKIIIDFINDAQNADLKKYLIRISGHGRAKTYGCEM